MSEYRNYDDEWFLRSDNYIKHVSAMTGEKLHSKSDIAAELAYRDDRIAELEAQLPKWISVDERLLKSSHGLKAKPVLVASSIFGLVGTATYTKSGGWVSHGAIVKERDKDLNKAVRELGVVGTPITHWMPLPQAPKEQGHE